MDLWELPLIVMDATLLAHRHLSVEDATVAIEALIDSVHRHNGLLATLWHNNFIGGDYYPTFSELYRRFMSAIGPRVSSHKVISFGMWKADGRSDWIY
jgi:hypothetical protein